MIAKLSAIHVNFPLKSPQLASRKLVPWYIDAQQSRMHYGGFKHTISVIVDRHCTTEPQYIKSWEHNL